MPQMNNDVLVNTTGKMLIDSVNAIQNPMEKVLAGMAASINYVSTTAALLMGEKCSPAEGRYPTNDHLLLAMFLLHESACINSDASVRLEFSPYRFHEALEDFKRFTNRSGESLIDPNLLTAVKEATTVDASKFGANRKFLQ